MRNQIITQGIVLSRTDFQEADRILTLITLDRGKVHIIAKGVRRPRSKLAGGIELLSISDITVLPGRGELGTLISSRLVTHYGNIVKDVQRTMLAYGLLKKINRATEDNAEPEYFNLLKHTLEALNDSNLPTNLTELWFSMQLLKIAGHAPNLKTNTEGQRLVPDEQYAFDFDQMAFREQKDAPFTANHIKLLRLALLTDQPLKLKQVTDVDRCTSEGLQLTTHLLKLQIHH